MAGRFGTGSIGKPGVYDWYGSSLVEHAGQPRRKLVLHANDGSATEIGADVHGNAVRQRPVTQNDVKLYKDGLLVTFGTVAEPLGVRFVTEDALRGTNLEIIFDASVDAGSIITLDFNK